MLSKAAADSNPEMKQKIATFAGTLCRELRDNAGNYMKGTVIALTANLSHQHSKVRKITLRGLKDVFVARGAEPFITESLGQLKYSMNDRSSDVRNIFYEVLQYWMTNMEISSLRAVESHLILFLLNGLSDENKDVNEKCKSFLEEHGKRMKEALQVLGEEEEEKEEDQEESKTM